MHEVRYSPQPFAEIGRKGMNQALPVKNCGGYEFWIIVIVFHKLNPQTRAALVALPPHPCKVSYGLVSKPNVEKFLYRVSFPPAALDCCGR